MIILLTARPIVINISGDWVSVLLQFLMLVLTIFSVVCAFRAYKHQKDRTKKDAACNLAKIYANSIIAKYGDLNAIFVASGIADLVRNTLELRDLRDFDNDELEKLLKKANVSKKEFTEKFKKIDPSEILKVRIEKASSVEERVQLLSFYTKKKENGEIQIVNGDYLKKDFFSEITDLMNELEWFAMNCRYGLADEELLYQSLHQSFLSTVWMLYYVISENNVNNEDKFFTNVIWLFIKWRDRLMNITDKKEARKQEYMNRAASVKAEVFEGTGLK